MYSSLKIKTAGYYSMDLVCNYRFFHLLHSTFLGLASSAHCVPRQESKQEKLSSPLGHQTF